MSAAPPTGYVAASPYYGAAPPTYGAPPFARREARVHDGFYVRMDAGATYAANKLKLGIGDQTVVEGTGKGPGGSFDLLLGGTPGSGLVIGGGLLVTRIVTPEFSFTTPSGLPSQKSDSDWATVMIGPFLDWFIDPKQGGHIGIMPVLAVASSTRITYDVQNVPDSEKRGPTGGGVVIFGGYDWWVGDEWSLGVLGRISYARMSISNSVLGSALTLEEKQEAMTFTAAFTALYH